MVGGFRRRRLVHRVGWKLQRGSNDAADDISIVSAKSLAWMRSRNAIPCRRFREMPSSTVFPETQNSRLSKLTGAVGYAVSNDSAGCFITLQSLLALLEHMRREKPH